MKKLLLSFLFLSGLIVANACDVCEKQQPEILKGITHGAGPETNWDYLIVGVTVIITLGTLYYSVKWLIWPEEKEETHIKRTILNFE